MFYYSFCSVVLLLGLVEVDEEYDEDENGMFLNINNFRSFLK